MFYMLMTVYECTNISSVLMRQEYVFHMLMSAGICLSCVDDVAGINALF
jgi:hypothetical protein